MIEGDRLLAIAKSHLALAIIARGKVGSKAERIAPAKTLRSKVKRKEIRREHQR